MAFGGSNNVSTGLLGDDLNDPRTQGVLGLATGLLAGGAPQVGKPVSMGGALAQGLNMGLNNFNAAQKRQDAMNKGKFQVVGGALLDLSDPSNPKTVYEAKKKPKVSLLGGGKYIAVTDDSGQVDIQKSPIFDDLKAEEDAKKTPNLSEAQKAVDKDFAKDYQDLVVQGGFADIDKGLSQLDEAVEILNTKGGTGLVAGLTPEFARPLFNASGLKAEELVSEVVQRNLRLILGAQFTEKEGERLIRRAFNPSLSEEENIKRIKRLAESIRKARDAKLSASRHYEEFGTLANYKGAQNITIDDIEADAGLSEDYEFEVE